MGAGIIAWLAGRVGATFAPLIFWGVIVLAGSIAVGVLWQTQVRGPYIATGEERAAKKYEPQVKTLTLERDAARLELATTTGERDKLLDGNAKMQADLGDLRGRVKEQTEAIGRLQLANAALRAAAKRAAEAADAAAARAAGEITRLAALASGPAMVDAAAQAERILSELADYVRQP